MSWVQASEYETELFKEIRNSHPEVAQLAQLTSLARTVEPLLLRNMRIRFMPASETELESQLWYSPLVSARSTRNFVLHHGVARLLANELKQQDLWLDQVEALGHSEQDSHHAFDSWQDKLWEITRQHTRHWGELDKLEQELRFYALQHEEEKLKQGFRHVLHEITRSEDEKQRLKLARWVKKTLAVVMGTSTNLDEPAWLAQYAAEVLGATANWTQLSKPRPMPRWLTKALPEPDTPTTTGNSEYQIGLILHYEAEKQRQVLEFVSADQGTSRLNLPTPLPTQVHISFGEKSNLRFVVNPGKRIALKPVSKRIILTTIDGKQYELMADVQTTATPPSEMTPEIYLTYVEEDTSQAESIANWLSQQQLNVKLVKEQPEQQTSSETGVEDDQAILLRLWTKAALKIWEKTVQNIEQSFSGNLILRTEKTLTPLGVNPAQIVELLDWQGEEQSTQSRQLLAAINDWISGKISARKKDIADKPEEPEEEQYSPEVSALLKDLENPETSPTQRLKISDQLAEMGDPRPGVSVKEYEIIEYSPEAQKLLDELSNEKTEPPQRLEIGNLLDEMGDPRIGAGLDENGLPEIDWVKIPAGEFIYGKEDSKTKLDTFYISRYTITNQQFQLFIDDDGYEDDNWWQNLQKPEPAESNWKQTNRPKESVDWYETIAFSRWLSKQFDFEVRLPTEQQWEKAARGTDGRSYPWGNQFLPGYANVNEKENKQGGWYLEETTAVGIYPQGQSPYGIHDMSGNVWEWCLNKYDKPTFITADTSGDPRAWRGGSWFDLPVDARADWRLRHDPGFRLNRRGFRVVCVLPSTGH